jgi:phosphoribosyl 1,2-cyclic phosphodiesterase
MRPSVARVALAAPACDTNSTLSVCVLASGSKGNAIYISDGRTNLLFDAGLSGREIQKRMQEAGLSAADLHGVVVSHEHSDHVRGVGILARRYHLPVYISASTAAAAAPQLGRVEDLRTIRIGATFNVDGLQIHPFSTSHDAQDPAGFTISRNGCKIGIATDLGIATGMVRHHLTACDLLVLEANHDPHMLAEGPYPWPLKQRIKGRNGHLSNEASRDLLAELKHSGLCHVILAHLSETNNTPAKAREAFERLMCEAIPHAKLHVAAQDRCTDMVIVR